MMLSPSQTGPRRAPFNFSELVCGKKARAHPCPAQIGNRLDRTDERARTAAMVSRSQPALDSFPQYHYSRGSASSSGAAPPAASSRFRPAPPRRRAVEKRPSVNRRQEFPRRLHRTAGKTGKRPIRSLRTPHWRENGRSRTLSHDLLSRKPRNQAEKRIHSSPS